MFEDSLHEDRKTRRRMGTTSLALGAYLCLIVLLLSTPAGKIGMPPDVRMAGPLAAPTTRSPRTPSLWRPAVPPGAAASVVTPAIDPDVMISPDEIPSEIVFIDDDLALPVVEFPSGGGRGGLSSALEAALTSRVPFGSLAGSDPTEVPPLPLPPPEPAVPEPEPVRLSSGMVAGFLKSDPQLGFPPLARAARIEGVVVLEAVISREGRIRPETLRVVSGHPVLARAASAAVVDWEYEPYLLNGAPVEVITTISVTYRLH